MASKRGMGTKKALHISMVTLEIKGSETMSLNWLEKINLNLSKLSIRVRIFWQQAL